MGFHPAPEQAWHGHGEHALHRDAVGVAVAGGGAGGCAGGVDHVELVAGAVVEHDEAVAADAGHTGLDDADSRGHGHGGVDGVAAALHDGDARLGRQRVAGGDHAPAAHDDGPM